MVVGQGITFAWQKPFSLQLYAHRAREFVPSDYNWIAA